MRSNSAPPTAEPLPSPGAGLPDGLRARYADTLAQAHALVEAEAQRQGTPIGVAMDRLVRATLDEAARSGANPGEASRAAYRRDHARLWAAGATPLEAASTRAHFDRLRSACRWAEAEAIARLRNMAEAARKAKETDAMREATRQAFERAVVFRTLYLDADRPVWANKAAALRSAGQRPPNRSKRQAGRAALSPDQLLVALGNQRRRCKRVELLAATFAVFGIRPAELVRGVRFEATPDGLRLHVHGSKVDAVRGQPLRVLDVSSTRFGLSHIAIALLSQAAPENGGHLQASPADLAAVRRAMREAQPRLSPYAYRHARASDAKAAHGREGVAAWLGHANDRTQQHYGHKRSGRGAVAITGATATRTVRRTKTLPLTLAERFARVAVRLMERTPTPSRQPVRTPARRPGPRW